MAVELERLRRRLVDVAAHGSTREVQSVLAEITVVRQELWSRAERHRLWRDPADPPASPRGVDEL